MNLNDETIWPTIPAPGPWRADGSCATLPAEVVDELFFPNGTTPLETRRLCGGCEVRLDCLSYALDVEAAFPDVLHGVWAGTSRGERARLVAPPAPVWDDPADDEPVAA